MQRFYPFFFWLSLLFLPFLGVKDFYSRGEAREALVAQSMHLSNNFLLPEGYNGAVPSKPPLLHWLINVAGTLTGSIDEFSTRLPSALAALLGAYILYRFIRARSNEHEALFSSVLFATTVQWFRNGTSTRVDLILSVAILIALTELYTWWERRFKGFPLLASVSLSAAILTKGPIGIALPMSIFGVFLLLQKEKISRVIVVSLLVSIPAALVASVWYGICYYEFGQRFFDKIYYENVARLTSTMEDEPHKHSAFYLIGTLVLGLLPWSIPAFFCIKKISIQKSISTIKAHSQTLFFFLWLVGFVVFFSIPSSKRDTYLLPAYAPACWFVAQGIRHLSEKAQYRIAVSFKTLAAIVVTAGVLLMFSSYVVSRMPLLQICIEYFQMHKIAYFLTTLIAVVCFSSGQQYAQKREYLFAAAQFWIAILIVAQGIFAPAVANAISYRSISDESEAITKNETRLYSFLDEFYGVSFYLKKPFISVATDDGKNVPFGFVYVIERNLDTLKEKLAPGQCSETVLRSTKPIVKEDEHVLVQKVYSCQTPDHE